MNKFKKNSEDQKMNTLEKGYSILYLCVKDTIYAMSNIFGYFQSFDIQGFLANSLISSKIPY